MTEYKVDEGKLREQRQEWPREASHAKGSGHLVLKIVAGVAVGVVAVGLITSLNDIKRYIRMTRM